jgi:hypothetical protein
MPSTRTFALSLALGRQTWRIVTVREKEEDIESRAVMSHNFEDAVFKHKQFRDDLLLLRSFRKLPRRFEDLEFERCTFVSGLLLSSQPDLARRMSISHARLINCRAIACSHYDPFTHHLQISVEPAIIEGA